MAIILSVVFTSQLWAHSKDQSYLYLRVYQDRIEGTVEATYKDLRTAMGIDLQRGMQLEDLGSLLPRIQDYIRQGVSIRSAQGNHDIRFVEPRLMEAKMGVFLKSDFVLENVNSIPESMDVSYDLIFEKDPSHRAFLVIRHHWPSGIIDNEGHPYAGFSPTEKNVKLDLTGGATIKGIWKLFKMGMQHLLTGLDHMLFILAFVVPFFVLMGKTDTADNSYSKNLLSPSVVSWTVLFAGGLVTGFVLGASTTLNLGSSLVESAIALSLGVLALGRLKSFGQPVMSAVLVVSGLFHGLGFASVLLSKNLRGEYMGESIFGFSLGVLVGILVIIGLFYLLARVLSKKAKYSQWIQYFLYACLIISIYWLIERAFGIDLLIDTYIGKAFGKVFGIFHHH